MARSRGQCYGHPTGQDGPGRGRSALAETDDPGGHPHDTIAQTPAVLLGRAPTEDGTPAPLSSAPAVAAVSLIGRRLGGKYEVKAIIGRGGLGTVYRGIQAPIGREVAIKVINRQRADDPSLRKRFQREAAAAAHLKHPGIVALYDFGEDAGELYMVMELVDGRELRQILTDEKRLAPTVVVDLARQICEGLAHAHDRGLVHRDMKPENIMISKTSFGSYRAQILDFGIVKSVRADAPMSTPLGHQTRAGVIMGTPAYLSPEQAYARGIGPATDQYSLGVMLYEMLTGELPYHKGSEFEVMTAHCIAPFPPMPAEAEVPPALEAVVRRAMAKTPEERFADVQALADALTDALAGRSAPAPVVEAPAEAPAAPAAAGGVGRRFALVVLGGLALGGGSVAMRASRSGDQPPEADAHGAGGLAWPPPRRAGAGERGRPPRRRPPRAWRPPRRRRPRAWRPRDGGARERGGPRDGGARERPAPQPAPTPRPGHGRSASVRISKLVADCASEFADIRKSSRNQSLSRGSGFLPARGPPGPARAQRPVLRARLGIDTLLSLCGEQRAAQIPDLPGVPAGGAAGRRAQPQPVVRGPGRGRRARGRRDGPPRGRHAEQRLGLNPRKIHVIEKVPTRAAFVELFRRGAPFQYVSQGDVVVYIAGARDKQGGLALADGVMPSTTRWRRWPSTCAMGRGRGFFNAPCCW
ncbi:MAG: serine/threonine-protein kinase [bacterium]